MVCKQPCNERLCTYGCLRDYEVMVRNLVYHIMRDTNEVDDIVQDVLLKTYQSMQTFRGGSFRAYLCTIARNQCYDNLRKARSRRSEHLSDTLVENLTSDEAGPEETAIRHDIVAQVKIVMAEMNQVDQEIMLLRHVHQFSYKEISAVVGMQEGAVRTRLSRARQRVLAEMERRETHAAPDLG